MIIRRRYHRGAAATTDLNRDRRTTVIMDTGVVILQASAGRGGSAQTVEIELNAVEIKQIIRAEKLLQNARTLQTRGEEDVERNEQRTEGQTPTGDIQRSPDRDRIEQRQCNGSA